MVAQLTKRRRSITASNQTKTCPSCLTSMPADFKMCGTCGVRLGSQIDIEAVNRDSSGAIRLLVGPGFSAPQPPTAGARSGAGSARKVNKKVIKKRTAKPGPRKGGASRGVQAGSRLKPLPPSRQPDAGPRPAAGGGRTRACPSCGMTTGPENKFCGRCGAPLGQPGPKNCPRCATEAEPGQKFCGRCGGQL